MTELQKYLIEKLGDLPKPLDNVRMAEFISKLMEGAKECTGFLEEVVDDVMVKMDL